MRFQTLASSLPKHICRCCRLADFGLSRMLDLNKTHVSTQTYGTLPFMPVELLSEGHMGKSADVRVPWLPHRVMTHVL